MKLIQLWKLHPCSSRPRTAIRCVDGGYVLVAFVCMCCDCAETESAVGADSNGEESLIILLPFLSTRAKASHISLLFSLLKLPYDC